MIAVVSPASLICNKHKAYPAESPHDPWLASKSASATSLPPLSSTPSAELKTYLAGTDVVITREIT